MITRNIKRFKSKKMHNRTMQNRQFDDIHNSIFNNTTHGIALFDNDGRIFDSNKQFSELLGPVERYSYIGSINGWRDSICEFDNVIQAVIKGDRFETVLSTKDDGQRKQAILIFEPLISDKEIIGGYVIITDITIAAGLNDQREARLRKLIDKAGLGIVILDQNHRVLDTNPRFAKMLGYSIEEMYDLHIWDWDAEMDENEIRNKFKVLAGLEALFETTHRRKDGSIYNVEISAYGASFEEAADSYNASICICQDVTDRKEIEKQLRASESRYRNLVENSSEIIFSLDEKGSILYISPNCLKITGYNPSEIQGKKLSDFFTSEKLLHDDKVFREKIHSDILSTNDFSFKHKDDSTHWYNISFSSSYDTEGKATMICNARNIDERKEYEQKLQYLSTHDKLTGIYNRRFFDAFLEHQFKRREYPLTLLICDIDKLKSINDKYGHAAGDRVIESCVSAIQSSLRRGDFLARTGGDEFIAILPSTDETETIKIINRIKQAVDAFNDAESDQPFKISVSIGSATAASEACSIQELMIEADSHMYEQKSRAKRRM